MCRSVRGIFQLITTVAVAASFTASCAGGGGTTPAVASNAAPNAAAATQTPPSSNVPVTVKYALPASIAAATAGRATSSGGRSVQFISPSNTKITVVVTPVGGAGTSYGPAPCTTGACVISFTAAPGPTVLAFTLIDNASNVLSSFSTTQIVQPATENTFSLTASPVVASVTLNLASAAQNAGTPYDDVLTVNAKDFDGNVIVGNGNYVDAGGTPLALSLTASNSQNGGNGNVTIRGPVRISNATHGAISIHYNGGWLDHAAINVSSTRALSGALTGTTFTATPAATEYSAGFTAANGMHGCVAGPDGNIWAAEYSVGKVAKVSTAGTVLTEYAVSTEPQFLTVGRDGAIWFTESSASKIGRLTTSGGFTEFPTLAGEHPIDITNGPDGNLWFGYDNNSNASRLTLQGTLASYSINPLTSGRGIITGPDGRIWLISEQDDKYAKINIDTTLTTVTYPGTTGNYNDGIVIGPDGNVWFIEAKSQSIAQVTYPGGVLTAYSAGITANAQMRQLTVGPDGNMWFTEENNDRIGRITTAGTVTEFTNGFSAGSQPVGICVGPDGNLWIGEDGNGRLAKFVY